MGVECGVSGVERRVREVRHCLWGVYCMVWSVGRRMLGMGCVVPVAGSWATTVRCGVLQVWGEERQVRGCRCGLRGVGLRVQAVGCWVQCVGCGISGAEWSGGHAMLGEVCRAWGVG